MVSSFVSKNEAASGVFNCTTASTFEKLNSLKFELLFGEYRRKIEKKDGDGGLVNVVDYMFDPGQIFGFAYETTGSEFKRMHHIFVLRACLPGESGNIIAGISPGAEVLVKTLSQTGSKILRDMLGKLKKNNICLNKLSTDQYKHLNRLLEIKTANSFFIGS